MKLNINTFSDAAHKEAEDALAIISSKYEVKVKAELEQFAKEFNERYPNHVVKFYDGMGQRSIELYHRLRQKPEQRIMWFVDGESFDDHKISSPYGFVGDYKAYDDVIELLEDTSRELCMMGNISASAWICTNMGV